MGQPKEFKMPKGKISMGKKTPKPASDEPTQLKMPGRSSIYKGTDKRPSAAVKVKPVPAGKRKPPVYGNSNYKPKPTPKRLPSKMGY